MQGLDREAGDTEGEEKWSPKEWESGIASLGLNSVPFWALSRTEIKGHRGHLTCDPIQGGAFTSF